jgi:hypothetical protein
MALVVSAVKSISVSGSPSAWALGSGEGLGCTNTTAAPLQLVEQRGELRGELRVPEVDAAGVTDEQDAI